MPDGMALEQVIVRLTPQPGRVRHRARRRHRQSWDDAWGPARRDRRSSVPVMPRTATSTTPWYGTPAAASPARAACTPRSVPGAHPSSARAAASPCGAGSSPAAGTPAGTCQRNPGSGCRSCSSHGRRRRAHPPGTLSTRSAQGPVAGDAPSPRAPQPHHEIGHVGPGIGGLIHPGSERGLTSLHVRLAPDAPQPPPRTTGLKKVSRAVTPHIHQAYLRHTHRANERPDESEGWSGRGRGGPLTGAAWAVRQGGRPCNPLGVHAFPGMALLGILLLSTQRSSSQTQANTSNANVPRGNLTPPSRGVLSFFACAFAPPSHARVAWGMVPVHNQRQAVADWPPRRCRGPRWLMHHPIFASARNCWGFPQSVWFVSP